MNVKIGVILAGSLLFSCGVKNRPESVAKTALPLPGSWKLIAATVIDKGDTVVTDYTKNVSFIKIINDTHFAFLKHNLSKDSTAGFDSGGGRYTLNDSLYTEYLDYCNEREWEGTTFNFTISIKNDTLIQEGIETVEKAGINRLNRETYVRLKP